MTRRLQGDTDAIRRFRQSFGIHDFPTYSPEGFRVGLDLFPDTPVKLLKDVFEALELYDLVDLLEQSVKFHTTRALRQALTLDEIRKLRNTSNRPTTFHSCAAVLIFTPNKDDLGVNKIKSFFKGLNSNSDVTTTQWSTDEELERMKRDVGLCERAIQQQSVMARTGELQRIKKGLERKVEVLEREKENERMATAEVIDRWIRSQGWYELNNMVGRFNKDLVS